MKTPTPQSGAPKAREYVLRRRQDKAGPVRVVPSRPSKRLRVGGGRKDSPGWTDHKRRSNRRRFDLLRPFIKTGVTIIYPDDATPAQLQTINNSNRTFCRAKRIPARCVWEGPGKHHHIALGIAYDSTIEEKWKNRIQGQWRKVFGVPMASDSFLWKPEIKPNEIASYLSKTWDKKSRLSAKGIFAWLTFSPTWETGFQQMPKGQKMPGAKNEPRKKCISSEAVHSPEKVHHAHSPSYTVDSPEKVHECRPLCQTCHVRWGRSLWEGSCICTGHVSLTRQTT